MTENELLALDELQFIERAYPFALGRPADPKGLRDYLQRLRTGTPKTQVLTELRVSGEGRAFAARQRGQAPESTTIAGNAQSAVQRAATTLPELLQLDDDMFVDQAYRLVLGREADDSGRQNYGVALRTGVDRVEVLRQLMKSQEGRARKLDLPDVQAAIEGRRLSRVPGIRQALRAWALVRRQLRSAPNGVAGPAVATADRPAVSARQQPVLKPIISLARPLSRKAETIMSEAITSDHEGQVAAARLREAAEQVVDGVPEDSVQAGIQGTDDVMSWALTLENFVGATLHGWSFVQGEQGSFSIEFGGRMLGKVRPSNQRPDVQETFGLHDSQVGFSSILGGLLQFSAMAADCPTMRLAHVSSRGGQRVVNLHEYLNEALTFSPMRALMRPLLGRKAGSVRSMRLVSTNEASIIFEADGRGEDAVGSMFIDLYQEQTAGSLTRIARFAVEMDGQVVDLRFRMLDADQPILMVLTDIDRSIIATDCFPLPSLMSEENSPLIEYHVVLETGTLAYAVAAKIARTFLDTAINARLGGTEDGSGPLRSTSCLVLFCHGNADVHVATLLKRHRALAAEAVFLDREGVVHRLSGERLSLTDFVADSTARHMLFLDAETQLRPDFWSVVDKSRHRMAGDPELIHWHAIWIDGVARPQVVKTGLLLHPTFHGHQLIEARSLMVRRDTVAAALERDSEALRSGRLVLETTFSFVNLERVAQLPIVMDIVRAPIQPTVHLRYQAEQATLTQHPGRVAEPLEHPGVSVVINYRDGIDDTLRCLSSIQAQELNGPIEIVLVNNGSTSNSVVAIVGRARELFGSDNVRPIEYPQRFNHSAQCNVAVMAARHDLLLMLSNDSRLRTPRAIARAAQVAMVPWVGTCGYRIVGNEAAKSKLQSLGLALNERRYLFSGGSPLATCIPPQFAIDSTFEVVGNTFAAVMLRREVYVALDGLDSSAFPTNFNDVDFSMRATSAGYRHIAIGSEIVEHIGRGSREADQDLPIDQRVIERAPPLDVLARIGFQQL